MPDTPTRYEVRTPNARFTGVRAGLAFRDGRAVTRDAAAAAECRALGYAVKELKTTTGKATAPRRGQQKGV